MRYTLLHIPVTTVAIVVVETPKPPLTLIIRLFSLLCPTCQPFTHLLQYFKLFLLLSTGFCWLHFFSFVLSCTYVSVLSLVVSSFTRCPRQNKHDAHIYVPHQLAWLVYFLCCCSFCCLIFVPVRVLFYFCFYRREFIAVHFVFMKIVVFVFVFVIVSWLCYSFQQYIIRCPMECHSLLCKKVPLFFPCLFGAVSFSAVFLALQS